MKPWDFCHGLGLAVAAWSGRCWLGLAMAAWSGWWDGWRSWVGWRLCLGGGGVVWAADVKLEKFFGFVQFSNLLLYGILRSLMFGI
jgi:hypothetical protein